MTKERNSPAIKSIFHQLTVWDIVAFTVFIGLLIWYGFYTRFGISIQDETFYYTLPMRVMQGDRLLVDEWHVSQLTTFFYYLPYSLFVRITGSNEGVILFMRYMSTAVVLTLYWVNYILLRKYRVFALIPAFLTGICFVGGIIQMSYYNIPALVMLPVCIILFSGKQNLAFWKLILLGLLVACAVLSQPMLVLIYVLFSILCLVRFFKPDFLKEYDFLFNKRLWSGISTGCFIAFAAVVGVVVIKGGFLNILHTIPELFKDSEYNLSIGGGRFDLMITKFEKMPRIYGAVFFCGGILTSAIAAFYRKRFFEKKKAKAVLLAVAGAFFVAQTMYAVIISLSKYSQSSFQELVLIGMLFSFPNTVFGLSCYMLLEKKNPRIFLFWLTSILMDVIIAFCSEVYVSISGPISVLTPLLCLYELQKEQVFSKPKTARQKRIIPIVTVASIIVLTIWNSFDFFMFCTQPYVETMINRYAPSSVTEVIEKGPQKGIKTTRQIKTAYNSGFRDMDFLVQNSNGQPIYIAGLWSAYYLYADLPVSAYSVWFVEEDYQQRQLRYWELHPEKRPKYCYVPDSMFGMVFETDLVWGEGEAEKMVDKSLTYFQTVSDCTISRGKAGYIVEIKHWK